MGTSRISAGGASKNLKAGLCVLTKLWLLPGGYVLLLCLQKGAFQQLSHPQNMEPVEVLPPRHVLQVCDCLVHSASEDCVAPCTSTRRVLLIAHMIPISLFGMYIFRSYHRKQIKSIVEFIYSKD